MSKLETQATGIVDALIDALIEDLSDRRGLKREWAKIDADVQDEIRDAWTGIVYRALYRSSDADDADALYEARTRLRLLLASASELLAALDAHHARDPGDADTEKLSKIRLQAAMRRLRQSAEYIAKVSA